MKKRDVSASLLLLLLALAPLGTRYIWRSGELGGVNVEPGTLSIFLTQILAVGFVVASFFAGSDRKVFIGQRSEKIALVLAVLILVSSALSNDPSTSLLTAGWVVLGIILVFVMGRHRPSSQLAFVALAAGAVFQAVLGIFQFLTQKVVSSTLLGMAVHSGDQLGTFVVETAEGRWLRAYGTLPHPNMYGILLAVAILIMTTKLASWRARARIPAAAAVTICAWGLFLSFSRSAYLALAVGLVLILVAAWRYSKKDVLRGAVYAGLIVTAVFSVLGLFYIEPLATRFAAESRLEIRSLEERSDSLDDALTLLARRPLLGVGPGMMPATVSQEVDPGRSGWDYQFVHNTPLLVLVELGSLGTMVWIALLILALKFSLMKSRIDRKVPIWVIVFISLMVAGMFDHYLWSSWFGQLIFWLTVGFMMTGHDTRVAAALDNRP